MSVNTQSDRSQCPPWGLDGGGDATGNRIAFRIGGQWKDDFPNAKVLMAQLKTDDAYRISSGGGGGYGSPFERPAEQVAEDVRQGYVSVEAAAEKYGVVIDPRELRRRPGGDRQAASQWPLVGPDVELGDQPRIFFVIRARRAGEILGRTAGRLGRALQEELPRAGIGHRLVHRRR